MNDKRHPPPPPPRSRPRRKRPARNHGRSRPFGIAMASSTLQVGKTRIQWGRTLTTVRCELVGRRAGPTSH